MKSPYIGNTSRLADVIAAIQAMSLNKEYKLSFEEWADLIAGDFSKANHWKSVFLDHPEFFRIDRNGDKASLVWRRSMNKIYHIQTGRSISRDEFANLPTDVKKEYSREPLTSDDVRALVTTAIQLTEHAEESNKNKNWWRPTVFGLSGVVLGYALEIIRSLF